MAVPFSNTKLRVPRGFQNLLEGFAREVLRSQPTELYAFGAQYFENLLKTREEGGIDPAEHGAKMEDRFYNNKAFTEPTVDPSDPQQQEAATAIQTKYRQHAAKQEVENIREEKAATKIQAGFRGHQDRQRVKNIRKGEEQATPSAPADTSATAATEEAVDIDLNDPDVEAAAVKIQAGFKGFKARQEVSRAKSADNKKSSEPSTQPANQTPQPAATETDTTTEPAPTQTDQTTEEVDIDLTDPEVEEAAIKIQAGFKGLKVRKEMSAKQREKAAAQAAQSEETEPIKTEPTEATSEEPIVPSSDPVVAEATDEATTEVPSTSQPTQPTVEPPTEPTEEGTAEPEAHEAVEPAADQAVVAEQAEEQPAVEQTEESETINQPVEEATEVNEVASDPPAETAESDPPKTEAVPSEAIAEPEKPAE